MRISVEFDTSEQKVTLQDFMDIAQIFDVVEANYHDIKVEISGIAEDKIIVSYEESEQ